MKHITIKYGSPELGLNSRRLILNAVIDIMEGDEDRGIVEISPENHLEDIETAMKEGLVYNVDSDIIVNTNLRTNKTTSYIHAFICKKKA